MQLAQEVTGQMLALNAQSDDPTKMVINSPGGHVGTGDTIHDLIRFVTCPVHILGTGWVASADVHIFLGAPRQQRSCLPNTRFMIHQPSGDVSGKGVDVAIEAAEMVKMRDRINTVIASETGQNIERVAVDTDRNYWTDSDEAKEYGIIYHH
jgi:ATP-dependent Clp protease, protease subunit